jgi:hypothetical protein
MKKTSRIRLRNTLSMYGVSAPNMTQENYVGDASVHMVGLSQPLYFKDIATVFPEKVIFDLTLSVAMVQHNTTVLVSARKDGNDEQKEPKIMENIYEKNPAVQSISWSKPFNVHCIHQGAMRPNDPSWTITLPYDTYRFDTLEEGEIRVDENQYCHYGGLWNTDTSMDKIAGVNARFSYDSDDIDPREEEKFGQAVQRGGIDMELVKMQTSLLTFGAYKMHAQQAEQNNGLNDYAEHYKQKYRSMYYEMLDQNTMRMHFAKNNTA